MRMMARDKNRPTPTPTVRIRTVGLTTALICPASTERSGSATVMSTPIRKQTQTRTASFLDLIRPSPTWRPMGVMARSAPRLNRPMPSTSSSAQSTNTARVAQVSGASGVKEITSTMTATGSTDTSASQSLCIRAFFISSLPTGWIISNSV